MGRTGKKKMSTQQYRIETQEKNKGFSLHYNLLEGSKQCYKNFDIVKIILMYRELQTGKTPLLMQCRHSGVGKLF